MILFMVTRNIFQTIHYKRALSVRRRFASGTTVSLVSLPSKEALEMSGHMAEIIGYASQETLEVAAHQTPAAHPNLENDRSQLATIQREVSNVDDNAAVF